MSRIPRLLPALLLGLVVPAPAQLVGASGVALTFQGEGFSGTDTGIGPESRALFRINPQRGCLLELLDKTEPLPPPPTRG